MEGQFGAIAIVGAGNVAWHLARAIDQSGLVVRQVCSRHIDHSIELAAQLKDCQAIDNEADISSDTDLCIIAATDSAVTRIAASLPPLRGIVAHTSGSVSLEALEQALLSGGNPAKAGVFYPLQTFSKGADVDVAQVPFFTEANDAHTLAELDSLALAIGASVNHADSEQRTKLHIAAVFACNFANHLWAIASELLASDGYNLQILRPLLQATLDKAMLMPPAIAQTGPASRGDLATIDKHLAILSDPGHRALYEQLSRSIMSM